MPARNARRNAPMDPVRRPMSTQSPDPDPEPPAAPPIIILSQNGQAAPAPHHEFQEPDPESGLKPHAATSWPHSSQDKPSHPSPTSRYNLRNRTVRGPKEPTPDPFPCAPPVIILPHKRPASATPPRSPPFIDITTSIPPSASSYPNSASSISPTLPSAQTSAAPTPAVDQATAQDTNTPNSYFASQLVSHDTAYHRHTMGSKASKLAPSHGKLQPSLEKQDKAEMKEPSNYYTHRSKSMRRKAGKAGTTDAAGAGAGGGVGGGV